MYDARKAPEPCEKMTRGHGEVHLVEGAGGDEGMSGAAGSRRVGLAKWGRVGKSTKGGMKC